MTSPSAQVVFPDAVAVVRAHLLAEDPSLLVHSRVPNPRPAEFVQVRRAGGTAAHVVDRATVSVDCWAASPPRAMQLALQVRQWVHGMAGQVVGGVTVYGVQEFAGPADVPDDGESLSPRVRQTFEIGLRGQ